MEPVSAIQRCPEEFPPQMAELVPSAVCEDYASNQRTGCFPMACSMQERTDSKKQSSMNMLL